MIFLFLGEPADVRQGDMLVEAARFATSHGYHVTLRYQDVMAQWYLYRAQIPYHFTYQRHQVKGGIIFGLRWDRWFWLNRLGYIA